MRIRAQITMEIDAVDFIDAATHQAKLEDLTRRVQSEYGQARLSLKECRAPRRVLQPGGTESRIVYSRTPVREYLD